ncbi:hypothetical protein SK128_011599 [Halocaridina rubra]|uniref:Uncharacterized protein n=1 Tax=Halocaridina rubra TaxID=373956 RepID=A0AAN8X335_HALRR
MSDEMQGDSSTKKRKWYLQSFKLEWLEDPELLDWLQQVKKYKDSYCKCCKVTLKSANKTMLLKQKSSVKHKRCFDAAKSSVDITWFIGKKKSTKTVHCLGHPELAS